jgi:hypothetical protein
MRHSSLLQYLRSTEADRHQAVWVAVSNPPSKAKGDTPHTARPAALRLTRPPNGTTAAREAVEDAPLGLADQPEPDVCLQYLTADWSGELRTALMQTAFLHRLTRSAVTEITRQPGVFDALQRLADAGALLRRDPGLPSVLRFDPALRAHLQELARSTLQPTELSDLLWRATALMERELDALHPVAAPRGLPAIRICALGGFLILRNGSPLPRHRKSPGKPLTLLKALVALGAGGVPSHTLADLLWPEAEGDHADARLTTTLHRTRALLGAPEAIVKDSGELSLNRALVSCDVLEFHDLLQRIEAQQHPARESGALLLKAYPGTLLPACTGEAWLQPCRERLAAKFAGAVARVGRQLEAENHRAEAQTLYLEALAKEPLAACLKRFL